MRSNSKQDEIDVPAAKLAQFRVAAYMGVNLLVKITTRGKLGCSACRSLKQVHYDPIFSVPDLPLTGCGRAGRCHARYQAVLNERQHD